MVQDPLSQSGVIDVKMIASAPGKGSPTTYRTASVAGLVYIFLIDRATAHEHHGEDIPEGEAISAKPIVCLIPVTLGLRRCWTLMNEGRTQYYGYISYFKSLPLA